MLEEGDILAIAKLPSWRKSLIHFVRPQGKMDIFIIIAICVSSILLALESPILDPETGRVLGRIDKVFTIIFFTEMALKMLAHGLFAKRPIRGYFRQPWNYLDFVVVSGACLDWYVEVSTSGTDVNADQLQILRMLRMVRALRPLRMISRAKGLRIYVNTILRSAPLLLSCLAITAAIYATISVVALNLFMGTHFECSGRGQWSWQDVQDERSCVDAGGVWRRHELHFDNFGATIFTITVLGAQLAQKLVVPANDQNQ